MNSVLSFIIGFRICAKCKKSTFVFGARKCINESCGARICNSCYASHESTLAETEKLTQNWFASKVMPVQLAGEELSDTDVSAGAKLMFKADVLKRTCPMCFSRVLEAGQEK